MTEKNERIEELRGALRTATYLIHQYHHAKRWPGTAEQCGHRFCRKFRDVINNVHPTALEKLQALAATANEGKDVPTRHTYVVKADGTQEHVGVCEGCEFDRVAEKKNAERV